MSEDRRDELLAKITKVASNDAAAFAGTESDIKVSQDEESGNIAIDLIAHWIQSNEDEPDKMLVNYAAAKSTIKNASLQYKEKSCTLIQRIVSTTLKGMHMPGGQQELAVVQQNLTTRGTQLLLQILQG